MNEEEIIKKKLLIDGGGTGEDRKINMLLKKFVKWCNTDSENQDRLIRDQLLSQLSQVEYAYKKSRLIASMTDSELENYKNINSQIEEEMSRVREEIAATKEKFKEAKVIRKNRLEYEVLAKVINEQPDRKLTNDKLEVLKSQIQGLEETSEKLQRKLEMRKKQFHVLFSSLQQLQCLLDEDNREDDNIVDVSLDDSDEDEDSSSCPKDVDMG